jgi:hypothetical protein
MKTAALWHFDELSDVPPSDRAHNVADLMPPSGLTSPVRVDGIVGGARTWAAAQGLAALELVADATLLRRSMAIEAIFKPNGNGVRTIVQRGKGFGTTAERKLFALTLTVTLGTTGALQMAWQKSSGAAATVAAVTFQLPSSWLYLAATRRWLSASSVEVDYWVNDVLVGTVASADGDIEDGVGGTILVGATDSGGAIVTGMIVGDSLDELRLSNVERAQEEFLQEWRRCFVFPEQGRELVRQMLPPGDVYSKDPLSIIQREVSIEGDAMSLPWGKLSELQEFLLPDRASQMLPNWERINRQPAKPADTIQARRNRILAHTRKLHGFSRQSIKDALAPVLGTTSADLTVIENSNRYDDTFPGAALGARWSPTLHGGTAVVAAGNVTLAFASGDHRWDATHDLAVLERAAVQSPTGAEMIAKLNAATGLVNTGDIAGVFFQDNLFTTGDVLIFGIRFTNPGYDFISRQIIGGVVTDIVHGPPPAGPWWLRLVERNGTGTFDFYYSAASIDGPWISIDLAMPGPANFFYAGLALIGGVAAGAAASAAFAEVSLAIPGSLEVFQWYILRTGGTGTPDYATGRLVIDQMKPAHTMGWIVTTVFLTDDPGSLCDTAGDVLGM